MSLRIIFFSSFLVFEIKKSLLYVVSLKAGYPIFFERWNIKLSIWGISMNFTT